MNDSNWLVLEDSSLDAGPGEIVEYGRVVVISPASWTAERVLFEKTPSFRTNKCLIGPALVVPEARRSCSRKDEGTRCILEPLKTACTPCFKLLLL